jgi:hypothetical protein
MIVSSPIHPVFDCRVFGIDFWLTGTVDRRIKNVWPIIVVFLFCFLFLESFSCWLIISSFVWLSCVGNGFPTDRNSRSSDQNCSTDHCRVGSLRFCFWSARRATWWGSFFAKLQIFALFCNLAKWHTNYSTVSNSDSSVLFAVPHPRHFLYATNINNTTICLTFLFILLFQQLSNFWLLGTYYRSNP